MGQPVTIFHKAPLGALLALLTLSACASQPAMPLICPAHPSQSPLERVDVIDGPPEEMAILKPEEKEWTPQKALLIWDVDYIYDQHRQVYVRCVYAGKSEPIIVKSTARVKMCTFTKAPKTPASLICR